jgi:hypothetical protein
VGWDLKAKAGKKKGVLELGGNAAVIVDNDADLDDAVERSSSAPSTSPASPCIGVSESSSTRHLRRAARPSRRPRRASSSPATLTTATPSSGR